MKAFFKRMWAIFPIVLVPAIGMLLSGKLFGSQHIGVGLALIFYNAMTARQPFTMGRFIIDLFTFVCVTVLSLVAGGNLVCSILLNGLVFFLLIICFSDELTLAGYYIYGMLLMIGQTQFPTSMSLLPGRIGSLLLGMTILLLYKLYIWRVKPVGWKRGVTELHQQKKQHQKYNLYERTHAHLTKRLTKESLETYTLLASEADGSNFSVFKSLWIRIQYRWKFRSCYLGFAAKIAIAMTLGFAASHLLGYEKIHWLPITIYAMVLPSFETTKQKAYASFYGTMGGAVLFVLIFRHVPAAWKMTFMVLIICIVLSLKNEIVKKMVSTQLSLALSTTDLSHFHFAGIRIAIVFAAMLIALVINQIASRFSHPNGIPINAIRIRKINDELLTKLRQPVKTPTAACYRNLMLLEVLALEDKIRPYQK